MKEILEALENDARLTPEKISTMTGIPIQDVKSEIKKAEGIIMEFLDGI